MSQYQEKATVLRVEQLSKENFRLTLDSPDIARTAKAGQFVMIRAGVGKDPLLRRPLSIHQTSAAGHLQIYFKVVGRGTEMLACVKKGEVLAVLGPLGRGFRLEKDSPAIIIGGGLGIAPMLFLARTIFKTKKNYSEDYIILGGREKNEVEPLVNDFKKFGMKMLLATDDGSYGVQGLVTDLLKSISFNADCTVYACGPEPMMAGVYDLCRVAGSPCQVSVESVMACGMGACLGCSRLTKEGVYAHVCLNGPVFNAEELIWNT